jgi:hypothetical protein
MYGKQMLDQDFCKTSDNIIVAIQQFGFVAVIDPL